MCVEYIIDHGTDSDGASQEQILHHQAYLKATAERDLKEIQREMELVKYQSQQAMCDYFTAVCEKISTGVPALTDININYLQRKFDIERQQFEQKLPMYARKGQFLHLLRHHQAVVLKGGTGIGKTVTVPQWCYDDILCAEDAAGASTIAVAVLVPRKAIAEGLAAYIAKVRNVRVGEEVGLGTGDYCKLGPNSRISFFTYGFFAAITKNDKYFSQVLSCCVFINMFYKNRLNSITDIVLFVYSSVLVTVWDCDFGRSARAKSRRRRAATAAELRLWKPS